MKVYETNDIRNVALAGHGHCGKTSLAAALLFTTGATNRLTRVDEGNTMTDYDEEEIARKITISTKIAAAEWNRKKINLLDTPGYNMFITDTKSAMVAVEASLVVIDASRPLRFQAPPESLGKPEQRFLQHRHHQPVDDRPSGFLRLDEARLL